MQIVEPCSQITSADEGRKKGGERQEAICDLFRGDIRGVENPGLLAAAKDGVYRKEFLRIIIP